MRGMQPSTPRVSVVMAVRDGDRWLTEAIDSVLSQSERASHFKIEVFSVRPQVASAIPPSTAMVSPTT